MDTKRLLSVWQRKVFDLLLEEGKIDQQLVDQMKACGLWEGPLRTLATARAPPTAGDSDREPTEPRELQLVFDPEYL